ncbi:phage neck terminator protein [Bacillus sp. JJ722]|uniref:phage neck terminator protein n=1 Tax=Bacillus sp. JJ722 TaxID=3122973 RepID=UPI003000DA95
MIIAIKSLIAQIYKDTGLRVIKAYQKGSKLALPYGVYNVTSPYIKDVGQENESYIDTGNDFLIIHEEQFKSVLSFNIYATNDETAIDLALQVRKWFLFLGQEYIQSQNIAIISVGNVEARTTFLVDSYEHKHGFDVQLRLTDEQSRQVDYFNKIGELKI